MSGCRIGKVTLKGGAILHRLPPPREPDEGRDGLIRHAVMTASYYADEAMAGFVILAWAKDGSYNVSYYIHRDSSVGIGMAPSFIADALRRRMIEVGDWES